jgi:small-conductance mechanosensitive channel
MRDRIDESEQSMSEAEDFVEEAVDDGQTVERTLDAVDLSTTEDAAQEVEQHLEGARDAAEGAFDERDEQLERLHDESRDVEEDIGEREEIAESNERVVTDGQDQLRVREVLDRIDRSLDAIRTEISFLKESEERIRALREASDDRQTLLRSRIGRGE